jgi:hypothetical protein
VVEDTGTGIQNQNLIGDDVADEINAAIAGEQMNGNVTPPTIVQPTHASGQLLGADEGDDARDGQNDQTPPAENGTVNAPAEPAASSASDEPETSSAPAEPERAESAPAETEATLPEVAPADDTPALPPEEPADQTPAAAPTITIPDEDRGSGNFTELQAIKQDALTQLGPLVQHLDQDPEERFNTLLMMIRASDDATLVQTAYEAAKVIADDKKKAQALLDIVNEVNYLTRPQPENEQA